MLRKLILKKHSDPEVYIVAALFEYQKMSNIESARLYFLEGLKYHKSCKRLHIEDFGLEALCVKDTDGDSLPIALNKYKNMIKCFKGDIDFHFNLIDKALTFYRIWTLQYEVVRYIKYNLLCILAIYCFLNYLLYRDMFVQYKQNERMWQKLSKITFAGYVYDIDSEVMCFDRFGQIKIP